MGKRRRLQSRMCRRRRRRALRKAAVQPPQLQETIPRVAGRIRRALRAVSRPRWRAPSASRCTCLWRSSALRYGRLIGASCRPGMILDEAQRRCVRDPMRRGATCHRRVSSRTGTSTRSRTRPRRWTSTQRQTATGESARWISRSASCSTLGWLTSLCHDHVAAACSDLPPEFAGYDFTGPLRPWRKTSMVSTADPLPGHTDAVMILA